MRPGISAMLAAAGFGLTGSSCASVDHQSEAWFLLAKTTERWCAFVTEASAVGAAGSDLFESAEAGWLQYRDGGIDRLTITSQSEDAYVEDAYTFAPDLSVKQVVRRGRYVDDPFVSATFKVDGRGLSMDVDSRATILESERAGHETYFFDWLMYLTLAEMPFSALIGTQPKLSVSEGCL